MAPQKPDPSLLPIERPRCAKCSQRMHFTRAAPGAHGFELRNFECAKCETFITKTIASDPMHSPAAGWLSSELKSPE